MIVLGIDTSAVTCAVALVCEGEVLSSYSCTNGLTHSETLLPAIQGVLKEAELSVSDLDVIAVAAGPGSFTGLRIGISAVKGLAVSLGLPCAAISTLEGLGMNAASFEGATVCALMDARRGEFYNAVFSVKEGTLHRLTPDRAVSGETVAKELENTENLILLGDGAAKFAEKFPQYLPNLADESLRYQSGISIAKLATFAAERGDVVSCEQLSPRYLRLPQAEREWLEKNKSVKNG